MCSSGSEFGCLFKILKFLIKYICLEHAIFLKLLKQFKKKQKKNKLKFKCQKFFKVTKRFYCKKNEDNNLQQKEINTNKKNLENKSYLIFIFEKIFFDINILYKIFRLIDRIFFSIIIIGSLVLLVINNLYEIQLKFLFVYIYISLFLVYLIFLQFLKINFTLYKNIEDNKFFYKNLVLYVLNLMLFFFLIVFSLNTENKIGSYLNLEIDLNLNFFIFISCLLFINFYLLILNYSQINRLNTVSNTNTFIEDLIKKNFIRLYFEPLFNYYEKNIFYWVIYFSIIFKVIKFIINLFFGNFLLLNSLNTIILFIFFLNSIIYVCIWFISDVLVFLVLLPKCFKFNSPLDEHVTVDNTKKLTKNTLVRRGLIPLFALGGTFITFNFVHQMIWPDFEPPLKRMSEKVGFQSYMREKFDYPPIEWKITDDDNKD